MREWAIIRLGAIGNERAAEPLIHVLSDEKARTFRAQVARALGRIGVEKAIDALTHLYKKG